MKTLPYLSSAMPGNVFSGESESCESACIKKLELSDVFAPDIQTNLFSETPFEKITVGLAKL
jgi:hypothetical protein